MEARVSCPQGSKVAKPMSNAALWLEDLAQKQSTASGISHQPG